MYISGTGISEFEFRTMLDYKVDTVLALKWAQASNGDWLPTDRGQSNDFYECKIGMAGYYTEIANVVTQINNNRTVGSNEISLTRFNLNEQIFGADVVYSNGLSATVLRYPTIRQKSLNLFTIDMTLRLLGTISFTAVTTLPELNFTQVGYDGNIDEHTITKYDTYNGNYTYLNNDSDVGIFKGTIILSYADMARLRRYHAVNRGGNFSLADIPGVNNPFGPTGDSYPIDVRIKNITNEKIRDQYRWTCDIELVNYKTANA